MQRGGIAGPHENARADDAADAEEHQVPRPERPLELAGLGFALNLGNRFAQHHAPEQTPWSGSGHSFFPLDRQLRAEPSGSGGEGNPLSRQS